MSLLVYVIKILLYVKKKIYGTTIIVQTVCFWYGYTIFSKVKN